MSKKTNEIKINNINNIININKKSKKKYTDLNLNTSDEEMVEENLDPAEDNEYDFQPITSKNLKKYIPPYKDLRTERLQYKKNKETNFLTQDHIDFTKGVIAEQKELKIVKSESFEFQTNWFENDLIKYLKLIKGSSYEILINDEDVFHIEIKVNRKEEILHFKLRLNKADDEFVEYKPLQNDFIFEGDLKVLYEEVELFTKTMKYFFAAIMEYIYK
jgi:hypothetical protein